MKLKHLDDDVVLDRVTAALVDRPRTFSELFGVCALLDNEPMPSLDQVEEAVEILRSAGAIQEFKERRFGERMRIFGLKSESRTYWICDYCEGKGMEPDSKRGMCKVCHGNGLITPVIREEQ